MYAEATDACNNGFCDASGKRAPTPTNDGGACDVWNGATWVNIWASGGFPAVQDTVWTHVSHDITAHKNAAMRVRFGFDIQSSGVFTVSSWNIDDVVVANAVCN